MEERNQKILISVIEEYIESAIPIGSSYLVSKKKLDCCPATVRSAMMELEQEGYLFQPHISAGRIPTEKAYHFYVQNLDLEEKFPKSEVKKIEEVLVKEKNKDLEQKAKSIAKNASEMTKSAILLAFSKHNYYITGFSNILSQPEFKNSESLYNLSVVFDNLELIVENVFGEIKETEIFVGAENKFNKYLSVIAGNFKGGVILVIGPTRMNYKKNLGLINYFKEII